VDAGGEVTGLGSGTGACHESQKSVGSQTGVVIEPPTEIGTLSQLVTLGKGYIS